MDADRVMQFLSKEGFHATLVAPDEVRFKYEGGNYMVRLLPGDDFYAVVMYPNFWTIQSPGEEVRALRAANRAVKVTKVGKVHVLEDRHQVWADAELLITRPEEFEAHFRRCLVILQAAVNEFVKQMRASEPVSDTRVQLKREEITRWTHRN